MFKQSCIFSFLEFIYLYYADDNEIFDLGKVEIKSVFEQAITPGTLERKETELYKQDSF